MPQLLAAGSGLAAELPPFYRQLLGVVADKFTTSQAPGLDPKDGVNRNHQQVYTLLQASTLFSVRDKENFLARELRRIG